MAEKKEFEEFDMLAFVSVLLAGVLLGFIAHELVHMLLISNVSSITVRFGQPVASASVCSLSPGESAYEELAYTNQFIVTILWIILNNNIYRREIQ